MDKKNMVLGIIAVILLGFVLFSTFRGGITSAATFCDSCNKAEDCGKYCYNTCIKQGYDVVTSSGMESEGKISCSCTCESYLNNLLITGKAVKR